MKGRRLPDTVFGELPDDIQPGDFWKYLDRSDPSKPMDCGDRRAQNGNLTRTVWGHMAPTGSIGTLMSHTVREEEDGSISVRPGDGSSNSILHTSPEDKTWHGYIEKGVWTEC